MANYWSNVIRDRVLNRRRALALSASALGGAALLAACGGGSSQKEPAAPQDKSGLLTKSLDTTSKAVAGGTLTIQGPDYVNIDPVSDQIKNPMGPPTFVYQRMLKFKVAPWPGPASMLNVEGDAAQSWEKTPDGLTVTFKLRANQKWEPRAPLNGRAITSQDLKYSWDKFEATNVTRGGLMKSANPEAPIESVTTPDANTVVLKLAYPFTLLEHYLANNKQVLLIPPEAEDKVDLKQQMRGSGPWMMDKWEPSIGWEFIRNPNWYVKDRPFYERAVYRVIPEYAARLAQLQAGNVDLFLESLNFTPGVEPLDALQLKKSRPQLQMLLRIPGSGGNPGSLSFDYKPGSPFLDVRVRRAINMLLDRDAFIDTFYNVPAMVSAGLSSEKYWHSHFGANDADYWIDPRDKQFGEGGQYFQLNPTEAKRLLQAAAFPFDKDIPYLHSASQSLQWAQTIANFLIQNGGLKVKPELVPAAQNAQRILQSGGTHDGLTFGPGFTGELDQHITQRFIPGSGPTVAYEKVTTPPEFTRFIDLYKSSRREADPKKRIDIVKNQVQKEMASQMQVANLPGVAPFLTFAQPWVGNWATWKGVGIVDTQEIYPNWWFDSSKKS
jgi:ABC-type transport system substrate-binding protein